MNKKMINAILIIFGILLVIVYVLELIDSLLLIVSLIVLVIYGTFFNMPKRKNAPKKEANFILEEEKKERQNQKDREMKTCHVCGTKNIINRKYCKKCNTNIQNITCPVCDHKNPFNKQYCEQCDSILQNKNRH